MRRCVLLAQIHYKFYEGKIVHNQRRTICFPSQAFYLSRNKKKKFPAGNTWDKIYKNGRRKRKLTGPHVLKCPTRPQQLKRHNKRKKKKFKRASNKAFEKPATKAANPPQFQKLNYYHFFFFTQNSRWFLVYCLEGALPFWICLSWTLSETLHIN